MTPRNPLRNEHRRLLDATINRYFYQNWSLFAPDPIASNQSVLARCLSLEEMRQAGAGGLPTSDWHDLSTPFWMRYQSNRFSAYDRLVRPQANAARHYMSGGPLLAPWFDECRKGSKDDCRIFDEGLSRARAEAGRMLARVGASFCNGMSAGRGPATHVALRLRDTPVRLWNERFTGERKSVDIDLGVYPVNPAVVATRLYRTEDVHE